MKFWNFMCGLAALTALLTAGLALTSAQAGVDRHTGPDRSVVQSQTVRWHGGGHGAKYANVHCPPSKDRIRVWALRPGRHGRISKPGVLAVRMYNGTYSHVREPNIERVGKHWEYDLFTHGRIDTYDTEWTWVRRVKASPRAHPRLTLMLSACIRRGS